jgi:hypothetical protein
MLFCMISGSLCCWHIFSQSNGMLSVITRIIRPGTSKGAPKSTGNCKLADTQTWFLFSVLVLCTQVNMMFPLRVASQTSYPNIFWYYLAVQNSLNEIILTRRFYSSGGESGARKHQKIGGRGHRLAGALLNIEGGGQKFSCHTIPKLDGFLPNFFKKYQNFQTKRVPLMLI